MKKLVLMLIATLCPFASFAQNIPFFLYGESGGGFGIGASSSGKIDLNSVFLKNNIVSVGLYIYAPKARNIPADYQSGLNFFSDGRPDYTESGVTFMYGKMIDFPDLPRVRISMKGGALSAT